MAGARGSAKSHHSAPKNHHRGGIRKHSPQPRIEKDGDLVMGGAGETRGRPQGGGRGRGSSGRGPSRTNAETIAKALGRGIDTKTTNVRSTRKQAARHPATSSQFDSYDQIIVRGWAQSEAAKTSDRGIPQLIDFIDRKASHKNNLKIINEHQVRGDNLFIYTKPDDRDKILRLNNFQFARGTLIIELKREATVSASDIMSLMKELITSRHNEEQKFLDLSALGTDVSFVGKGMFDTEERSIKFFTAMMVVIERMWPKIFQRSQVIQSISLANNGLTTVKNVTTLSQTFPKLQNLDLSDNQLADHKALEPWSRKFSLLDHLILRGNAIETIPDFHLEILKWFPRLRTLDTVTVRTDEEIGKKTAQKMPVGPGIDRGDFDIAQNFITQYYAAFDTNRMAAISTFYSDSSIFSLNVKTSSPKNMKVAPWSKWIALSRNLSKITSLNARDGRLFAGLQAIDKVFSDMPSTKHPALGDGEKWLMDCNMVQGLSDPTGQSPSGVNGLIIDLHGEFEELKPDGQVFAQRSFDRKFVLGPGETPGSVKIMRETLTVRPYSGTKHFKPTSSPSQQPQQVTDSSVPTIVLNAGVPIPAGLVVPPGFATPAPDKTPEQLQQEILTVQFCEHTRMTVEYAAQCLQTAAWDPAGSLQAFEAARPSLPSTAFW